LLHPVQIWLKLFVPFFSRRETLAYWEIYSRSSGFKFKYLYLACKLFVAIGNMRAKYLPVKGSESYRTNIVSWWVWERRSAETPLPRQGNSFRRSLVL
jgi:hypothetical protein